MRITNGMIISNFQINIQTSIKNVEKYMSQLGSGKKMSRISDDPIGVLNALTARGRLARLGQYQGNLDSAESWVNQCDSSLQSISTLMTRIRDEMINANSTAKTEDDRQNIVALVKELKQTVIESLNASVGKQYIFAGYNTTNQPFTVEPETLGQDSQGLYIQNPNAGLVLYNGLPLREPVAPVMPTLAADFPDYPTGDPTQDAAILAEFNEKLDIYNDVLLPDYERLTIPQRYGDASKYQSELGQQLKMEVGYNYSMDVTMNGLQVVGWDENNLFNQLDDIIEFMEDPDFSISDSFDKLSNALDTWDKVHTRITTALARVGAMETRVEMLRDRYTQDIISYNEIRAKIEDVDAEETAIYWKMAQYVYEQTLAVGARVIQPTLMDFLG